MAEEVRLRTAALGTVPAAVPAAKRKTVADHVRELTAAFVFAKGGDSNAPFGYSTLPSGKGGSSGGAEASADQPAGRKAADSDETEEGDEIVVKRKDSRKDTPAAPLGDPESAKSLIVKLPVAQQPGEGETEPERLLVKLPISLPETDTPGKKTGT